MGFGVGMVHAVERELHVGQHTWIRYRGDGSIDHGGAVEISCPIDHTLLLADNIEVAIVDENSQLTVRFIRLFAP